MDAVKEKTGFPSTDKPWLKYLYGRCRGSCKRYPAGKTVWDVIEAKLRKH